MKEFVRDGYSGHNGHIFVGEFPYVGDEAVCGQNNSVYWADCHCNDCLRFLETCEICERMYIMLELAE